MSDLKLALVIEALVKGAKDVVGLTGSVKDLGATATKKIPDNTEALREGAKATKLSVQDLTQAIGGLLTVGAIVQFARSSVQEFAKAESAFRGLEAVANASGAGVGNALKQAEALAADGLIGVSDASKALQNLLSRGYNLDQAVATITRLKDAAAFNRQASLSMADAVVSATEGLKNENSILVDNAGVTKNVAKMWEEYAKQRGITTGEMTQAMKIEAEYQGILAETAAQTGNAQKALAGFQGQMAQADQASIKFKQSLGESLAPTMAGLATIGTALIENVFKPLQFLSAAIGVRMGQMAVGLGTLWDAVTNLEFAGLKDKIRAQGDLAEQEIQGIARRLSGGTLKITDSLTGAADPAKAKEVADKLTAGAATAAKAQKEMAKDLKSSIQESIKDYQRLADAARDAWQKSADAQRDALKEAAALEAEARGRGKDSSIEGQALATLDLIAAEEKLQRIKSQGNNLEDVQAQVELVKNLAGNLDNQVRAEEAVRNAKLAQAEALRKFASEQDAAQSGLIQQQRNAEQVVKDLQSALDSLGKGVALKVESEQAKSVLAEITAKLDALKDKTITVSVRYTDDGQQKLDNLSASIPGHALGTILPGYGGGDRRLALLEDGEAITRKEAVRYWGADFMASINAMRLPRFAAGGVVGMAAGLGASNTPAFPHLGRIDLALGGASYPVYAAPDTASALAAVVRRAAMQVGARK